MLIFNSSKFFKVKKLVIEKDVIFINYERRLGKLNSKERKSILEVDRSARLVFVLAISAPLYMVFESVVKSFFRTFSSLIYTKNFLNYDYIYATISTSIVLYLAFYIIIYIFSESLIFRRFESTELKQKAINNADAAFGKIFKGLINSSILIVIIMIIIFISENQKVVLLYCGGFLLFIITICLILHFFKKEVLVNLFNKFIRILPVKNIVEWGSSTLPLFFGMLLFLYLIGLTISVITISSSNKYATIELNDTSELPLNVTLQNYTNPLVSIKITNFDGTEDSKTIMLDESIDLSMYSEAKIDKNLRNDNELEGIVGNVDKEIDTYQFSKTKFISIYQIDLKEYIKDGKYLIEIIMFSRNEVRTSVSKFMTIIEKKGNNIYISEKKFKSE